MSEQIHYNSWLEKHKTPFGAVKTGENAVFAIDCSISGVLSVHLIIHKDFGRNFEIEMSKQANDRFQTDFSLTEGQGLYFYYFKIVHLKHETQETIYYGNNLNSLGGEGRIYDEKEDVKPYQLTSYIYDDTAPEWYRTGIAYHIFVDRFYNGNDDGTVSHPKPNSFLYSTPQDLPMYIKDENGEVVRWEFFGGNLNGIIKKLPYLADLGISILYLSPIFEARSNHKYDTADYLKVDRMFGDEAELVKLIHEAKKAGIRILLDGVFNHTGADSLYFNQYGNYDEVGAYQSRESLYADWYSFTEFPEKFRSWWGVSDLPALNTDIPAVRSFLYESKDSVIRKWSRLGLGGWRIDVADELKDDFLRGVREALDDSAEEPVLIGEVWEDASNKIAYNERRHYIEGGIFHAVMNYPFRELILDFLEQTLTPEEAAMQGMHLKENYPPAAFMANFNNIGTHDTVRILTALQGNRAKLKQAFALLFTLPGVPCLYYGDEAGVEGGRDPDNRRIYPWGRENKDMQQYVQQLAALRNNEPAIQNGDFYLFSNRQALGLLRYLTDESFVVVLFNSWDKEVIFDIDEIPEKYSFDIKAFFKKYHLSQIVLEANAVKLIKKHPSGKLIASGISQL